MVKYKIIGGLLSCQEKKWQRQFFLQHFRYVPISIGYAMWTPEKSKQEIATELYECTGV